LTRRRTGVLIVLTTAATLAIVYFGVSALVLVSALMPRPSAHELRTPADDGMVAEALRFASADGVPLAGWLIPSCGTRAVILVHGVDSYGWDGAQSDLARAYASAGFHVLIFDLRGHGHSGQDRLGLGWQEGGDVRAAVDLLLARGFQPGGIGIHGTSYGAAVALIAAASIRELGAVVADSAFADVRDLMEVQIAERAAAPRWLSRLLVRPGIEQLARIMYGLDLAHIAPQSRVAQIAPRPVFFIHGERDRVIPVEHARRLFDAANSILRLLWVLPGRDHTEGIRIGPAQEMPSPVRERYLSRVVDFFDRALIPVGHGAVKRV